MTSLQKSTSYQQWEVLCKGWERGQEKYRNKANQDSIKLTSISHLSERTILKCLSKTSNICYKIKVTCENWGHSFHQS